LCIIKIKNGLKKGYIPSAARDKIKGICQNKNYTRFSQQLIKNIYDRYILTTGRDSKKT